MRKQGSSESWHVTSACILSLFDFRTMRIPDFIIWKNFGLERMRGTTYQKIKLNTSTWRFTTQAKHYIIKKPWWYCHKQLKWQLILCFTWLSSEINQFAFYPVVSVQNHNKFRIWTSATGLYSTTINFPIKCASNTSWSHSGLWIHSLWMLTAISWSTSPGLTLM